jgi:hypothetical protein
VESPVFAYLVIAAFGLLLVVSGGITYLTLSEWRDRRRRDRALRAEKAKPEKSKARR